MSYCGGTTQLYVCSVTSSRQENRRVKTFTGLSKPFETRCV
jgi:hypothetical protein